GRAAPRAVAVRRGDEMLLGGGEARVEGDDLGGAGLAGGGASGVARAAVLGESDVRVADLPLAGEEDEDVAGALGHELVDGAADRRRLVELLLPGGRGVLVLGVRVRDERAVAGLAGGGSP